MITLMQNRDEQRTVDGVMRRATKNVALFMLVISSVGLVSFSTYAATDTDTTIITATINSVISVASATSAVALNVTPVTGGSQSSASDVVTVATNNATGFNLKLGSSDATTTLTKGSDTIAAHSGTQASPTALANNRWGYRVDGTGGFGAGPTTTPLNNVTSSAETYAGISPSASAQTLKTTAVPTASNVTTVWYSVKVDPTITSGDYTETVTYTATTNP